MNAATSLAGCRRLDLRRIERPEGNLTPIEWPGDAPFPIARVYYLYDVPGGATRGGHAHLQLEQLILAYMGAFTVVLDNGWKRRSFRLDRAYHGLYVPPMIWRELEDFSSGAGCLVLASLPYDRDDYIYDYETFKEMKRSGRGD